MGDAVGGKSHFLSKICDESKEGATSERGSNGGGSGGGGGSNVEGSPTSKAEPREGDAIPTPLPMGDMTGDSGAVVVKLGGFDS